MISNLFSSINLDFFTLGIGISAILILGYVIFIKDEKSATHILFLLQAIAMSIWSFLNYVSYKAIGFLDISSLWIIRLVMFTAIPVSMFFLFLMYVFPDKKIQMKRWVFVSLIIISLIAMGVSLTPLLFSGVQLASGEMVPQPKPGPGIILFFTTAILPIPLGFYYLLKKYIKSNLKERKNYLFLLIGVVITFTLIILFNFVFPSFLENTKFIPYSALFTFPFIAFTAYAVVKHKFLSVKVLGAEIFTFGIIVVSLSEIIFSKSLSEIVFRFFIFVGLLFFGILLIRNVKKEVEQREKMEKISKELEIAYGKLQEIDQQKTDFLSIAAHQLRTPLSVTKGYLELLNEGAYGKVPAEMSKVYNKIDESNERLVKLIDEFLDITRIEQGRTTYDFALHDINDLIASVVDELKERAKGKKLKIIWEPSKKLKHVFVDEEKLRHVIFNFIDNAIKYTEKGNIKVSISKEGEGVSFRVQDKGIGFDKNDQKNFFQKFFRGENVKATNVSGTGVGLYVCHRFIESHSGRVWAKSPGPGKGSEFGFWIPNKKHHSSDPC